MARAARHDCQTWHTGNSNPFFSNNNPRYNKPIPGPQAR